MDTFPYESWAEALAEPGGYFTFGPGGNTASVIITLLAIALSVYFLVTLTMRENKELTRAAKELAEKWED